MGAKQTKNVQREQKRQFPAEGKALSLDDKEVQAEMNSMIAYSEYIQQVSQNQAALTRSQIPHDNSAFANQVFVPKSLPLDDERFVQSFHVEQEQAIQSSSRSTAWLLCGM